MLIQIKAIIILLLLLFQNCKGQHQNIITKEQYNKISKSVKSYDYNPRYSVRIKNYECAYEIYVNDMLITSRFETGTGMGIVPFPQYILKSGNQRLKVKVLPVYKSSEVEGIAIGKDAVLNIDIFHEEFGKFKETSVLKFVLPEKAQQLPYYELDTVFEAKVPYVLDGWSKGADLSKEDPKKLEQEVLEVYKRFKKAFEQKDVATIATMIYNREKEIAQAFFFVSGKEGSYDNGWETLEKETNSVKNIKPLENYKMRFFGDGKMVSLLRTDGKFLDYPAFMGETDDSFEFYGLYLHRPSPGAPLEPIR